MPQPHRKAGFMLLDLATAAAVMAVLVLGLSATYAVALMSEQSAHYHRMAAEHGQVQLERVLKDVVGIES